MVIHAVLARVILDNNQYFTPSPAFDTAGCSEIAAAYASWGGFTHCGKGKGGPHTHTPRSLYSTWGVIYLREFVGGKASSLHSGCESSRNVCRKKIPYPEQI